ncbi:MAG: CTP synthase [Lentisphaeria bacterium]|nr:CTP synthase [Candidatus Neomarinimicrobiota bacterium]MCF7842546.1 CTP synthase [Lentisphaeria bacterium]
MPEQTRSKKYVIVTGGVISGLGKGIVAASLGLLLKAKGYKVTIQKLDPYLNVDPGTMSPFQHGEVFVLDDGSETDLDLGHYERFIDIDMGRANNTTAGQVYYDVIEKERRGDYLGSTVQIIPHVTDQIKQRITALEKEHDDLEIIITEIGGTVGDIESLPFLEAVRQFQQERGSENVIIVHVTLIPYVQASAEMKTKPTQHSVMRMREIGLQPDILVCRTEYTLTRDIREKLALFCNVKSERVIQGLDAKTIYEVPLFFNREHLSEIVLERLGMDDRPAELTYLRRFVNHIANPATTVTIGVAGKYVQLVDAYKSIIEAFAHAGVDNDCKVEIRWIDAEQNEAAENIEAELEGLDGILIPGGFGYRGIEGKILAARYAREHGVPFLGICLGLQVAVIEHARHVAGFENANSTEFDANTPHPVIHLMPSQEKVTAKGATMRLGAYECKLRKGTKSFLAYGETHITERHRHRFEVNNDYRNDLEKAGMIISGASPDDTLVEMVELKDHPWFVATQAHPELKSRIGRTHPLFREFVHAAVKFHHSR